MDQEPSPEEVNRQFEEVLKRRLKTRRPYASYFEWDEQDLEERGVVREFVKSMKRDGKVISDPQTYKPDPPDCIAVGSNGERFAFEVSELVVGEAIHRTRLGESVWARWDAQSLFKDCSERLLEKDAKSFNGGPYAKTILLLYTDEPEITPALVREVFDSRAFDKPRNFTDAYLMMAPLPTIPHPGLVVEAVCPIFKMRFE